MFCLFFVVVVIKETCFAILLRLLYRFFSVGDVCNGYWQLFVFVSKLIFGCICIFLYLHLHLVNTDTIGCASGTRSWSQWLLPTVCICIFTCLYLSLYFI